MHAFRLLILLLVLTPLVSAQSPRAVAPGAIETYLAGLAGQGQLSGTLLIGRGAEILFEGSYGRSDYETAQPNTSGTLFAVASVTKPLTGIAARLLAADGRVSLEEPIAKWLPDFPNGSRITLAHLLGHRSGLPHRVTGTEDEQRQQTAESITRLASKVSLRFEPGEQRLYSSTGYSVLAHVLERAAAKPYAQLLRELILAPASATTALDATDPALATKTRAKGYFWTPDGALRAPSKSLSFLVGAGSLWATPRDLFNVVRRIVTGGYGNAVSGALAQNGAIHWTGWTNGFLALVDYSPATDVTLVFTGNLLTGASAWIEQDVPRLLARDLVAERRVPRPKAVALSADSRRRLEGIYDYGGNEQPLTFLSASLALLGGEYLLVATGDTSFFAPQNYGDYTVLAEPNGTVTAIQLLTDPSIRMRRVVTR